MRYLFLIYFTMVYKHRICERTIRAFHLASGMRVDFIHHTINSCELYICAMRVPFSRLFVLLLQLPLQLDYLCNFIYYYITLYYFISLRLFSFLVYFPVRRIVLQLTRYNDCESHRSTIKMYNHWVSLVALPLQKLAFRLVWSIISQANNNQIKKKKEKSTLISLVPLVLLLLQ